ncbi:MAG: type 4a pilus biogenesis protein PilO [Bacillota bacterium]
MLEKMRAPSTAMVAAIGVAVLALMLFLVYSQVMALKTARQAVADEQGAYAAARQRLQELILIKDNASVMEEKLRRYEHMLPNTPDENTLIDMLGNYGSASGTKLLSVRFGAREDRGEYTEMPVEIAYEGRYHDLLELLAQLQSGERALRIEAVKIGRGRDDLPRVRVDIDASAFFVPR